MVRAYRIATTPPCGPVFVLLDAGLQEDALTTVPPPPAPGRYPPPIAGDPPAEVVAKLATALVSAKRPLIMAGRVSNDPDDFARRIELAERIDARVLTDLKTGASFPTTHRLHPHPPGLYVSPEGAASIRESDIILSLDWIDLAGSLRTAGGGSMPPATVVDCTQEPYIHNGFSMDYQALTPAEYPILCAPDRLVARLLKALPPRPGPSAWTGPFERAADAPVVGETKSPRTGGPLSIDELARTTVAALAAHRPSYIRLPLSWPGEYCRFEHPHDYIGFDGGGGIGSGPGMAVGAALALRGSGRLPVAVVGDGDYLMGLTALWTGVSERVPLLLIVANNRSFFNDEVHQERVARMRGRPVENRSIGLTMDDPPLDLALLARGQGATGFGQIHDVPALEAALAEAVDRVMAGALCVVDVQVAPEYARAVSSVLLSHLPQAG